MKLVSNLFGSQVCLMIGHVCQIEWNNLPIIPSYPKFKT